MYRKNRHRKEFNPPNRRAYFSPAQKGRWELIYRDDNETSYQASGIGTGRVDVTVNVYKSPQDLDGLHKNDYNTLIDVSSRKTRNILTLYLMTDNFIGGEGNLGNGTVELSSINSARRELYGILGDQTKVQSVFTDEGLPATLQKRLKMLWNY